MNKLQKNEAAASLGKLSWKRQTEGKSKEEIKKMMSERRLKKTGKLKSA